MIPLELWEILHDELGTGFMKNTRLANDVRLLSLRFTEKRETSRYLGAIDSQNAYLAYFLPLNFLKIQKILKSHESDWNPLSLLSKDTIRILDYGCGPATATLALLDFFKNLDLKLSITLVDNQKSALQVAERLLFKYAKKTGVRIALEKQTTLDGNRSKTIPPSFDFVLATNVINEHGDKNSDKTSGEQEDIASTLHGLCASNLLFVEPGHRVPSQRLIRLRERLLKKSLASEKLAIIGPCYHRDPCPLSKTKNWCHFSVEALDPKLEQLSLAMFRDKRKWLKFSYLFFKVDLKARREWDKKTYRAIGDCHLISNPSSACAIDLCQPSEKKMLVLPREQFIKLESRLIRGTTITLDDENKMSGIKPFI